MYLCNYLLCKLNLWDHTTQIIRSVWVFFLPFIGHLVLNMNASFTIKYCILLLLFQNWRRQKLIWRLWSPKLLARIMSMIACWRSMKSYRSVGPNVYWIEYGFSCYYNVFVVIFLKVYSDCFNCSSDSDTTEIFKICLSWTDINYN